MGARSPDLGVRDIRHSQPGQGEAEGRFSSTGAAAPHSCRHRSRPGDSRRPDRSPRPLRINSSRFSHAQPRAPLARLTAARWTPAGPLRALLQQPSARPGRFGAPAVATEPEGWPSLGRRDPGEAASPQPNATGNGCCPRAPAPLARVPGSRRPPVGRTRGMIRWPSSLS